VLSRKSGENYNSHITSAQLNVEIFTVKKVLAFDETLKGINSPDLKELELSFYFNKKKGGDKVDVSVILGENDSGHHSLLLHRFWKSDKFPSKFTENRLYGNVSGKLSRAGLACRRTCGSSGLVSEMDAKTFFKFLNFPGAFPRKASGVKFMKHKLYWQCHYISPYKQKHGRGRSKKIAYSPPRRGGVFKVDIALMTDFPFFFDFAEAKIMSAIICKQITCTTGLSIHPSAVKNELAAFKHAVDNPERTFRNSRKSILATFVLNAQHTLVTHPVGYHRDYFKERQAKLENKKCFILKGIAGHGRGGGGGKGLCFAILDW
jgi:hypothetical protein